MLEMSFFKKILIFFSKRTGSECTPWRTSSGRQDREERQSRADGPQSYGVLELEAVGPLLSQVALCSVK